MKYAAYVYIVIGISEVLAECTHSVLIRAISKPLLMPALIGFYIMSKPHTIAKTDRLMITAWIFSWIGDIILMLAGGDQTYFLVGLVAFLITHLLFTAAFTMVRDRSQVSVLKQKIWILMPLLAYLLALMSVVLPAIGGGMRMPIAIYSSVIGMMVTFALNRYKRVSDSSFALVFGGALLFMFSDSLIAVNKFLCHGTLFMSGCWIMSTYIAGQYLIARGMLRNETID